MRRVLGTCGNWAEKHGHLLKGSSPFPGMVRYKEDKAPVSIFTPENIASLLKKADATLRPFLAIGAFAGLRTAELQRLDWSEIDLDRGFITVAASKAKTRRRRSGADFGEPEIVARTDPASLGAHLRACVCSTCRQNQVRWFCLGEEWSASFVHLISAGNPA